jgi:glycosyltransferase involved in cell wall biosynthesis
MARIGVIMPTHGYNRHLAVAVNSVIQQSLEDWTLNIVCDGAAEETTQLAERFASQDKRIRTTREARAGVAAARNRGLQMLGPTHDLVAFLDHDDRWLPGTLAALARALESSPGKCVGAHGIARFVDETGTAVRAGELEADLRRRRRVHGRRLTESSTLVPTTFAHLAFSCCIPVGTALIRREVLDRVGRFDERAVPADDYDMWLRLSRLGDFAFVDEVVMEYRRHDQPTWVRPRGIGRGHPYVRRKAITSVDNTPEQVELAKQGYRFCAEVTIRHAASEAFRLAGKGHFMAAARQLVRAAIHLGAYVRGAPGPWHV